MEDWKYEPAKDHGLAPADAARSLQREPGLPQTLTHVLWWVFIRNYLRFCHRLTVVGAENIPRNPPFVMIANHTSHLDAMAMAAPLPWRLRNRIFPVAAGDVFFETPAMAIFAAAMINALPIWRKNCGPHALQQLRKRLVEEPCAFILFPEGARSSDGKLMPFKAGLGMIVAGTSVPVVPCYLSGCYESMAKNTGRMRWSRITMHVGKPVVFTDAPDAREGWKKVAADLEAAVRALGAT